MLDDLIERLTSARYEDYGAVHVKSVQWSDGDLLLLLDVTVDDDPDLPAEILVTCRAVKECTLAPGYYADLSIAQDHVLLWHYTQPYVLTSFYGRAAEPLAVVGALLEQHVSLVEDWIPFRRYFNSHLRLSNLITGAFGMLADGPEPLILAYEEVMQRFGVSTSHHRSDRALEGCLWVMIFDDSYVIAENFKATASDELAKHAAPGTVSPVRSFLRKLRGQDE